MLQLRRPTRQFCNIEIFPSAGRNYGKQFQGLIEVCDFLCKFVEMAFNMVSRDKNTKFYFSFLKLLLFNSKFPESIAQCFQLSHKIVNL